MSKETERLERYLKDELGECRTEDVEKRLGELDELREKAGKRFEIGRASCRERV